MTSISIAIIEEQPLTATAISDACRASGLVPTGPWSRIDRAYDAWVADQPPTVAVVGADLLGVDPLATLNALRDTLAPRVLLRARRPGARYAHLMLDAGAAGVICTLAGASELIDAIVDVAHGTNHIPADLHAVLQRRLLDRVPVPYLQLTARERQIAGLTARGLAAQAVADRLFISLPTVRTHLRGAYTKLGVTSHAELLAALADLGLLAVHHLSDRVAHDDPSRLGDLDRPSREDRFVVAFASV